MGCCKSISDVPTCLIYAFLRGLPQPYYAELISLPERAAVSGNPYADAPLRALLRHILPGQARVRCLTGFVCVGSRGHGGSVGALLGMVFQGP